MKKLMSLFSLIGIFSGLAVLSGCSSAKKEVAETPAPAAPAAAQPAVSSPVDLGASSAGRGL